MRHWVLLVYAFRGSPNLHGGLFYEPKKDTRPFPNQLNEEYQYRPGLLNYVKTKPYAKRVKGYTTTFAKPDKKIKKTLRIQAESEVVTPKKEAWV
ncbi:hypothetical protein [Flavobacterium sp. MK4S-17]|uniref:hypothetical protein n=1 Tax=Flavobacterium sp. MK4S-17 TaxID=2543737 RepID=UPI0013599288|nr:hypothetical protein [Flavobacterium sp. MK4S-17]